MTRSRLQVLFAPTDKPVPRLQRNEAIALVNVMDRFAQSVETVERMRELELQQRLTRMSIAVRRPRPVAARRAHAAPQVGGAVAAAAALALVAWWRRRGKHVRVD